MKARKKAAFTTANFLYTKGKDTEKVSNIQAFDALIDAYREKSAKLEELCRILKERRMRYEIQ